MSTNFWKGDKAQFLLNKLAFLDKKEILSLNTDPSLTATDAPTDSFGLFGASIWVKLDDGSTTNWKSLDDKMKWRGDWSVGEYIKNDTVRDLEWTMIANKTTEERPAPVPTGEPKDVFIGDMDSAQVTAKQVLYGQRYSNAQGVFINSYRVSTVAGNTYRVFSVKDPLGTPIITELVSFEANSSAWRTFNITPILLKANTTFDLIVMGTEPDPTPTTFTGSWNYLKPTNPAVPIAGEVIHSSKDSDTIDINKTDDIAGDRSAELQALTIGDKIALDGTEWAIQATVDNTTYMTFTVAPASQSILTGVQSFTFETVTATPLTYGTKVDHWLSNANISGLYIADGDYDNIVSNDNAYSVDLNVTEADISEDWDVVAAGATAGSANPIVPFTVTETITRSGVTTQNTFPNVVYNDASTLITETPSYGRTTYTFLRDATISSTVVGGSSTGAGDRYATLTLFNSAGTTKLVSTSNTAGSEYSLTASMNTKVSAGDFLQGTVGIDAANSVYTSFSVTATAQSSGTVFASDTSSEIEVTEQVLTSSTGAAVDVFAFTGLDSDSDYEITSQFELTSFNGGVARVRLRTQPNNAGTILGANYLRNDATNASTQTTTPLNVIIKASEHDGNLYFYFNGEGTLYGNNTRQQTFAQIRKIQKLDVDNLIIENFGTVVAASTLGTGELENVFSAKISNNGTASVTSENQNFIQSVNRYNTGRVTVTFVPGFFTVAPAVTAMTNLPSVQGNFTEVSSVSTTGFVFYTAGHTGTAYDENVSIVASRVGTDYKSKANYIDSLLVENPEGSAVTYTKNLTVAVGVTGVVSELTFNNLIIGDEYEVTSNLNSVGSNNTSNIKETQLQIKNGATILAFADSTITATFAGDTYHPNKKFFATDTVMTVEITYITNATLTTNSFVQLEKKAKKLGVDQLGQVVTNHVTGSEYELKGQLWNGKQIYARSYETASTITNSGLTVDTIETGLEPIGARQFDNTVDAFAWHGDPTAGGGSKRFVQYNRADGVLTVYSLGASVVTYAGYRFTIKYTKP